MVIALQEEWLWPALAPCKPASLNGGDERYLPKYGVAAIGAAMSQRLVHKEERTEKVSSGRSSGEVASRFDVALPAHPPSRSRLCACLGLVSEFSFRLPLTFQEEERYRPSPIPAAGPTSGEGTAVGGAQLQVWCCVKAVGTGSGENNRKQNKLKLNTPPSPSR